MYALIGKVLEQKLTLENPFPGANTTLPSTRLTGVHTGPRIGRTDTKPTE